MDVFKQHKLHYLEKQMIIKCQMFFSNAHLYKQKMTIREKVSKCLGIAPSTVGKVVSHWNKHNDVKFTEEKDTNESNKFSYDNEIISILRETIHEKNKKVQPVTANILSKEVRLKNVHVQPRKIRRILIKCGFRYGRGKLRHYHAENIENVAFRNKYLRSKSMNSNELGKPKKPEIFLDESYCNLNHVAKQTWIDTTSKDSFQLQKGGKGPRICIVGAGIIIQNEQNDLSGKWVENSLKVFQSKKKKCK